MAGFGFDMVAVPLMENPLGDFDAVSPSGSMTQRSQECAAWPKAFRFDGVYQMKYSRDSFGPCSDETPTQANRLDQHKVHRQDHDFAVTWAKMYGGVIVLLHPATLRTG
jgi:hypothetical protein